MAQRQTPALEMPRFARHKLLNDPALPFGGFKESGFGRDQGRDALEKYTQTKSVWVNL
jgi:acyl-CoA reductase-like NAD-dependent aldehyde dehydrogenase